jgi:RNA polymerase sigma-70 factor (ECF subfamily)
MNIVALQELSWLEQAQRGDVNAFVRLVEAYKGPVYHLAYRMLGNAGDAEDATQETFLRMYAKLHTYRPERKLVSWVLSIAAHYCIDRLRRRRIAFVSLDDELTELASRLPLPEEAVLEGEARSEVHALVARLTPEYRVPVILHYWYDLTYKEIAEVMGLTPQAVKTRLHRARQQMAGKTEEVRPRGLEPARVL